MELKKNIFNIIYALFITCNSSLESGIVGKEGFGVEKVKEDILTSDENGAWCKSS